MLAFHLRGREWERWWILVADVAYRWLGCNNWNPPLTNVPWFASRFTHYIWICHRYVVFDFWRRGTVNFSHMLFFNNKESFYYFKHFTLWWYKILIFYILYFHGRITIWDTLCMHVYILICIIHHSAAFSLNLDQNFRVD